jgi:hypothetical protein
MLDVMQYVEQINLSIFFNVLNNLTLVLYPPKKGVFRDVGVEIYFWFNNINNRSFWNPGVVSCLIMPRCRPNSTIVIDYRCACSRFQMSPRGMVADSNTRNLSNSETRDNAGIRGQKLHISEST